MRDVWERSRPFIEQAIATSPGFETIEDVERLLIEGKYHLFASEKSAAVTEIVYFGNMRCCNVVHSGGDLDDIMNVLVPQLQAFAAHMGCDLEMVTGRKGWERVLKNHGFHYGWITMVRPIKRETIN